MYRKAGYLLNTEFRIVIWISRNLEILITISQVLSIQYLSHSTYIVILAREPWIVIFIESNLRLIGFIHGFHYFRFIHNHLIKM